MTMIKLSSLRYFLLGTLAIALVFGTSSSVTLDAAATDLFFSEYIEGSSNNKALEIYNGTGAPIDLGTGGYNVQMYFNGSSTAGLTINLTGTVAAGDVFVLAHSAANASILAQADQTNGSGWFNGDDAVVLRKGTTIIDVIGQIGFDPGTEWGSGLTSTADNTIRRKATFCAGDVNGTDAFNPATEWDGFAIDNADNLGSHSATCTGDPTPTDAAPTVTSTSPGNGASDVSLAASIKVTFSEPVTVGASAFSLVCSGTTKPVSVIADSSTTFTVDPTTYFLPSESCTLTVAAAQVSDVDTVDPPDTMAAAVSVSFTTTGICSGPFTSIPQIQGSGPATPFGPATEVTTQGVVVGDFEGSDGLQGFYMQDPLGDGNSETSDGIFVFTGGGNAAAVGDQVRVRGYARERFNQTALTNITGAGLTDIEVVVCDTATLPAPVDVVLPFTSAIAPERYEGMLVRLPQTLVISEYFNFERFGELVLALPLPGETRPFTPTAIDEPASAQDRADQNLLSRITLDDGLGIQNPNQVRHPNGAPFSLTNRFRGGDTVTDTVGVLGFDFSLYRIQPTGPATYTAVNPRPVSTPAVGGTLKVAAMNTLNFFLTLNNPSTAADDVCGGNANLECRGANSTEPMEFERQRTKLVAALAGLNADIVGLNEIENTPGVEPLGDPVKGIVAGLNALLGAGTYAFIDTGVLGTDAIRVGLVYKPSRVTPFNPFQVLNTTIDPRFLDTKNRPSLAQSFVDNANGAKFTIAVNHLKSKGSDCNDVGDPAQDLQGNCNGTRRSAAQALVDWLATDPTGSGDPDFLIVGDLNSYAKEDPIGAITAGADDFSGTADDYTNLIAKFQGPFAYSYVFDGQFGYLDHALGGFRLSPQVTGAGDWHINADEPDLLDYDTSFKPPAQEAIYESNEFRVSDHDAVVIGLSLCKEVNGTVGRDSLVGSSGRDCLVGRDSSDTLTGGQGPDLFTYLSIRDVGDTIVDFSLGEDLIDLSALLRSLGFSGSNGLTAGYVKVIASGAFDSVVQIDQDGPGSLYSFRSFVVVKNVTPAALGQPLNFVF